MSTKTSEAKSENVQATETQEITIQDASATIGQGFEVEILPKVDTSETLTILGNIIPLQGKDGLIHALKLAVNDAGRFESQCLAKGIVSKRTIKTVRGTGSSFVDLTAINQLHKLGLIEGRPEKVKARVDAVKGMNMLIDALALLGLAQRQDG